MPEQRELSQSTAESRRASEGRPRALAIWVWIRWPVAFAVIGFWVWLFVEQVPMQPMAYNLARSEERRVGKECRL